MATSAAKAVGNRADDPLLQREGELAAVAGLLAAAAAGQGGLLLLEGAPGLGKSTMLDHAATAARDEGFLVVRARGHELERAFAWGVVRLLFEAPLAQIGQQERDDLLGGPAAPARAVFGFDEVIAGGTAAEALFAILHAVHWLVLRLAERGPIAVVVDDAQWADEPSLRALLYLLGRIDDAPVALVLAARTHSSVEHPALEALAAYPGALVRELAALDERSVAELVVRRLPAADEPFVRRCAQLTAGNPLHVRELLRAVESQGETTDDGGLTAATEIAARSVGRAVLGRLQRLSAAAQWLAGAVAVFEHDVPLYQAAALAGLERANAIGAADELVRADVLASTDPLAFAHPLVRSAVYGGLAPRERAERHGDAAALLAQAGASVEQIAGHLLRAPPGRDAGVVDVLRRAAARALAQGVPRSAIRYLDRARQEPPTSADRAAVLAELARAEAEDGRPAAVGHLEAAIALEADPIAHSTFRLRLGRLLHASGNPSAAAAVLQTALDHSGSDGAARVELEASYLTSAMLVDERAAEAHRRVDAILARADALDDPAELALASQALVMRLFAGAPRSEVLELAHRLYGRGRLLHRNGIDSGALWHIIGTLNWCDDYAAAAEATEAAFAEARRRGSVLTFAHASYARSWPRLWTGHVLASIDDARAAVATWSAGLGTYLPSAAYWLVCGLLERDEPEQATAILEKIDPQQADPVLGAWLSAAHGRIAAHREDHEVALAAFLAVGERADAILLCNPSISPWRSEAGLAALAAGRREEAHTLIDAEATLAERFGGPRAIGVARRAAGLAARGEDAVALLQGAADTLQECGARLEHARALIDLGAAVRRAGRRAQARPILHRALEIAAATESLTLSRRARDELHLAGGRARPRAPGGHNLSPSEQRVAELASIGHTNREISNALFITPKSVEWHLSNIYRKLDIRGRPELRHALAPN